MPRRGDSYLQIRIGRNISFAFVFSLLVHLLLLLTLAPKLLSTGKPQPSEEPQSITVSLAPPPSKSVSAEVAPSVAEAIPAPVPKPAAKPAKPLVEPKAQPQPEPQPDSSTNKIIALETPAPSSIEVPLNRRLPVPAPPPEPAAPTDMMSYVNAARARPHWAIPRGMPWKLPLGKIP